MLSIPLLIIRDFFGLIRVCGPTVALRWLWMIATHVRPCAAQRSLQPADLAMGQGPFAVRLRGARARLTGPKVFSAVREIWVRDVYLADGFLAIPPNALVVDLGANMGNFTLLALAHGPGVKVICVECSPVLVDRLEHSLAVNGWRERARICHRFIGAKTSYQEREITCRDAANVPFITEREFIDFYGISHIDLLKCDIEGSEFGLFTPGSALLEMTDQLAIEVHEHAGSRQDFLNMLEAQGFEVRTRRWDAQCCTLNARRPAPALATPRQTMKRKAVGCPEF